MSSCPEIEELEQAAGGASGLEGILEHAQECSSCGRELDRIRSSNAVILELRKANVAPPSASDAGRQLEPVPGYEIIGEVHRGGQGVVYEAIQTSTSRRVALKMPLSGASASEREIGRFEREIELVAKLHHFNVVTLFESEVLPDGRRYFAMEFIDGEPLDAYWIQYRRQHGAPSVKQVLVQFLQICAAVAHAHQSGVIHRDLKPGNVLVDCDGNPHVVDFGLAKQSDPSARSLCLTQSGEFLGSLLYAAPEQLSSGRQPVDALSDVYALGLILFEALTGKLPYQADMPLDVIVHQIVRGARVAPGRVAAGGCLADRIPRDLDTIVLKAIDADRDRRYRSAVALADDLRLFLDGLPIRARSDSGWYMIRKTVFRYRLLVGATGALMLAILALTIYQALDARNLARLMSARNIERGRLTTAAGDMEGAERALWQELLHPPPGGRSTDWHVEAPLSSRSPAHFALSEFYRRYPSTNSFQAHHGQVTGIAIAPDGGTLITTGSDGFLNSRSVKTGELLFSVECGVASAPSFDGPGDRLAVGTGSGRVILFDTRSGHQLFELDGHFAAVTSLSFHPDGKQLATAGADGRILLHDLVSRSATVVAADAGPGFMTLDFSPDGFQLVAGPSTARPRQWRLSAGGIKEAPLDYALKQPVKRVEYSRDGVWLGLVGANQIHLVDLRQGSATGFPIVLRRTLFTFVEGGRRIAAAVGARQKLQLIDTQHPETVRLLGDHTAQATAIAGRDTLVATGDREGVVRLWDTRWRPDLKVLSGGDLHGSTVHDLSLDCGSRRLATAGGADGTVAIWAFGDAWTQLARLEISCRLIRAVALRPGEEMVAVGCGDGSIELRDLTTGFRVAGLKKRMDGVADLAFSPDGSELAVADDSGQVTLFDPDSFEITQELTGHQRRAAALAYSPDGRRLAVVDGQSGLFIWNVATSQLEGHSSAEMPTSAHCVDWSPTGNRVAVGDANAEVRLVEPESARVVSVLRGHQSRVFAVRFSPDGQLLASADDGGNVKVWEVASGVELLSTQNHANAIFAIEFLPDGRTLISASADRTVRLWDLSWFDRHIAGNLEIWINRIGTNQTSSIHDWARSVPRRNLLTPGNER